ncbi:TolC family protein [Pseudomonas veronii]|jgi:outer membrane protein, heavy metal efflux system|uniref:TolC family protein n=1 Tax=Pseudomonas veronii TaxID=76761 RepID=UPI0006961EBA|nr:TolC family protein [Pseudomonas veronii]MCT9827070.1 TolC family protein [Pseudomonas veronii]NMX50243.1 TolC family protein [Pseudomonas veronii]UHH29459.1 TolC family protein [Pseudomonas veronii]
MLYSRSSARSATLVTKKIQLHKQFFITAVVLLTGCASYQPQPLAPQKIMAAYEGRSLTNPELQRFIAARRPKTTCAWDLNTLTLAAYYYSPELDAVRARFASGEAATQTANQRTNPSLSLPLQYADQPIKPWTYGLALDIPIETAGKRGYRVAQAQQLSDAARLNIGQTAWQIRSRLRSALLDFYAASQHHSIIERQVDIQQNIVTMLEKQLSLGSASTFELRQEQIILERDRSDLANSEKLMLDAKALIAQTIGIHLRALESIKLDLSEFESLSAQIPDNAARRQTILNRTDILGALAKYEASQAALQLEVARQYPNLSLGLGYSFDQGVNKYSVTPTGITLPLFNRNEGPIAEAEAHRKEAAIRVEALQDQAINQTDSALQHYRLATQNLALIETQDATRTTAFQADQRSFDLGAIDRLALSRSRRAVNVDAMTHVDAVVQVQQTISQLENAIQQPLDGIPLHAQSTEAVIRK